MRFRTLLLASAAALALAGRGGATFPGLPGDIAFTTDPAPPVERMVSIDPVRGSAVETAAPAELLDGYATWSADGRRVAILRWEDRPGMPTREPVIYAGGARSLHFLAIGDRPAWAPDGRRLAFFDDAHGRPVYVADVVTGRVRRIASGGGPPAWSPDGTRVVYGSSHFFGEPLALWSVRATGGKPVALVRGVSVSAPPAWSPDSTRVAFVDDRTMRLRVLDLRTHRAAGLARRGEAPTWSPDGRALAYVDDTVHVIASGRDRAFRAHAVVEPGRTSLVWSPDGRQLATSDVEVVDVSTRRVRRVFGSTAMFMQGLAWPSARRILVAVTRTVQHVGVSTPDGSGAHVLGSGAWADRLPTWSADGRQIAFVSDRDGDDELFVMNADGTGMRQVTHNHVIDFAPSWSPDGTRLAFSSDRGGSMAIWSIGVDGSGARELGRARFGAFAPHWSPDGRRLAYTALDNAPPGAPTGVVIDPSTKALVCTTSATAIGWSPDATRLDVMERKLGTIWSVDADCKNPLFPAGAGTWSPDGRRVVLRVPGDWQPRCTIEGTEGPDVLVGTDGNDVICGFGGDDRIDGRGGHDVIYGGAGDDTLVGGAGKDWLFGGAGDDTLSALDGEDDVIDGGPGADVATADRGDDVRSASAASIPRLAVSWTVDVGPHPGVPSSIGARVWVPVSSTGTFLALAQPSGAVAAQFALGVPSADGIDSATTDGRTISQRAAWYASDAGARIARVDNTGVATVDVAPHPGGLIADSRNVWVFHRLDGTVSKIDVATLQVTQYVVPGARATGITGGIWLLSADPPRVQQVDETTGAVTRTIRLDPPLPKVADGPDTASIVGSEGGLWAALPNRGALARIDTTTGAVDYLPIPYGDPYGVALGAGSLWVATDRAVVQLDDRTGAVKTVTPVPPADVTGRMAVEYGYGALWLTNYDRGTLTRLTAAPAE